MDTPIQRLREFNSGCVTTPTSPATHHPPSPLSAWRPAKKLQNIAHTSISGAEV